MNIKRKWNNALNVLYVKQELKLFLGRGKIDSILYIVGEAPGRDEDIQGEPFVGRSGKLLTKMLEAIAIDRKEIFITNIVKCRPPENRDPQLEEIQACSPHLTWQINFGKPKYILTLGRFSTGYFLDDFKSSLKSLRIGTPKSPLYPHITVLPTYHPAAVLRSPERWKPLVWEDLKKLSYLLLQENFYNDEQKAQLKKNKVIE
jgi:uracil-DNA glycosylase family 4